MDGYGTLIRIEGTHLDMYDVTKVACVKNDTEGERIGAPGPGGVTRYTVDGVPELTVIPQGRKHASLADDFSVGRRGLERVAGPLPANCTATPSTDPLAVFDRFWASFDENYPFFAAKGIDWPAVRRQFRPLVRPDSTDAELRQLMSDMIRPLNDGHTALLYQGKPVYSGERPGTRHIDKDTRDKALAAGAAHLVGPEQTWSDRRLGVGELPGRLGYLRVSSFNGYVKGGSYADWEAVLDRALDALLTPANVSGPNALRGLVIDLRLNGGGADPLGLHIASRLTERAYVAYAKRARNDPDDPTRFTRPQPIVVQPSVAPRFTGAIAILTSANTASAGETFTQAMIGRTPKVVRIGESTQGVFSDTLERKLSPDWTAILPNEEFLDRHGKTFDGPGIPADVNTPVFTDDELANLQDSAIDRAEQILDRP
ncbi:S41 family peptidase [Embleya sp. AB8]|uniref:S41 family peptidase n=1 Tax=Embleya sp. AB8 TaxID=3156304 RepID=UPI003C764C8D